MIDVISVIIAFLRVLLGFVLVLFIPGFFLTLVFFPKISEIQIFERLVYSVVLRHRNGNCISSFHGCRIRGQYYPLEYCLWNFVGFICFYYNLDSAIVFSGNLYANKKVFHFKILHVKDEKMRVFDE